MNLAETSNQLLEQIQDSQSDYPQFPTDTPSERYNEVSTYYGQQIERLEWLIKNNAPTHAINAQTRFCHGLAIGLDDSNWLACVNQAHKLETNRQDTISTLSLIQLEAKLIQSNVNRMKIEGNKENKDTILQQNFLSLGMMDVLGQVKQVLGVQP